MKLIRIWLFGFVALLFNLPLSAQEGGHVQLKNEVFKEKEIVKEDGSKEYQLVPPDTAVPGDEVIYITTFTNVSEQEATDIVITNPVPNNSLYKAGSAFGAGTEISYSIDSGKTYDKPENLKLRDENGELRTATAEDYTTIRWVFKNTLKPGQESTVTFRTILQ